MLCMSIHSISRNHLDRWCCLLDSHKLNDTDCMKFSVQFVLVLIINNLNKFLLYSFYQIIYVQRITYKFFCSKKKTFPKYIKKKMDAKRDTQFCFLVMMWFVCIMAIISIIIIGKWCTVVWLSMNYKIKIKN